MTSRIGIFGWAMTWSICLLFLPCFQGSGVCLLAQEDRRKTSSCEEHGKKEDSTHDVRSMSGWVVKVSRELIKSDAKATEKAVELLRVQLEEIKRVVPLAAVKELQKVPIWISLEYPKIPPRAEYHPGDQWLRDNGRDPAMAKAVEFTNVRIFESECRRMPMLALHELAHAYHDRVLGNDHAEIRAAFEKAKAGGKYDRVERRFGDGKNRFERAWLALDVP